MISFYHGKYEKRGKRGEIQSVQLCYSDKRDFFFSLAERAKKIFHLAFMLGCTEKKNHRGTTPVNSECCLLPVKC